MSQTGTSQKTPADKSDDSAHLLAMPIKRPRTKSISEVAAEETEDDTQTAGPSDQALRSKSSHYHKLLRELGTGLSNLSSLLTECVDDVTKLQPSANTTTTTTTERYSWVIKEHRKRPCRFKAPFGSSSEKEQANRRYTAVDITHRDSLLIKDFQCFEMSSFKLSQFEPQLIKRVGICVQFLRKECYDPDCVDYCQDKFCRACPHLFVCNCSNKFDDTLWCAHLHVAYRMNMGVYGAKACLFIEYCYNFTEKRHLRAFIQGPDKMKQIAVDGEGNPDIYEEQFDYLLRSTRYHVRVLTNATTKRCECKDAKICKLCDACWCKYSCTCDDYWHDRQVCEHIHNVAMQRHPDAEALFGHFDSAHRIYLDEESVFERERRISIEQEHELSFYYQLDHIHKYPGDQKWTMFSRTDDRHITVMQQITWRSTCICNKSSTTPAVMCTRCRFCTSHYKCDCKLLPDHLLCRHMHAVARYEAQNTEYEVADAQEYVKKIILDFENVFEERDQFRIRTPIGPVEGPLEEETQMDVDLV